MNSWLGQLDSLGWRQRGSRNVSHDATLVLNYSLSNQGDIHRMAELRGTQPIIKPAVRGLNSWLTIVNELRTTYYADIMNIAIEFEKLNKTTNDLYFDDN